MKVDVVIPNYNHARFLPERIESVLAQTHSDFTVWILDDASTDESRSVIARYVGGRVRFGANARNSGSTYVQWQRAFAEGEGEYVWIAESDDVAEPRFLERMVAAMEAEPGAGYGYCQALLIDEGGEPFGKALPAEGGYDRDAVRSGEEELRVYVRYQSPLVPNASSVVFRRRSVREVGGPDLTYRLCGDLELYARLLTRGPVVYVAEALNRYRHHTATVRVRTERDGTGVWERYRFLGEFRGRMGWERGMDDEALARMADRWVAAGWRREGWLAGSVHRRIWAEARRVDPRLGRRLLGALWRRWVGGVRRRLGGDGRREGMERGCRGS